MADNPVDRLMILRLNVLPPFAYDDDEGGKDTSDYVAFLSEHGGQLSAATRAYRDALNRFRERPDDDSFQLLVKARKDFITCFPFASDELEFSDDFGNTMIELRRIYTTETELHEGRLEALLEVTHDCILAAMKVTEKKPCDSQQNATDAIENLIRS